MCSVLTPLNCTAHYNLCICSGLKCVEVVCSLFLCSVLQYSYFLFSVLQYSSVMCSALHCNTVTFSAVYCNTITFCAVYCNTVIFCAVYCNTVTFCAVQWEERQARTGLVPRELSLTLFLYQQWTLAALPLSCFKDSGGIFGHSHSTTTLCVKQ